MALKKLSEKYRNCLYVEICNDKCMEAVGFLQPTTEKATANAAASALRETITIYVDEKPTIRYKDEIEKELTKSLYHGLGLDYGA